MENSKVTLAHRYAIKKIQEYPSLKSEIADLIQWMYDEIKAGESPESESDLLISLIDELIE